MQRCAFVLGRLVTSLHVTRIGEEKKLQKGQGGGWLGWALEAQGSCTGNPNATARASARARVRATARARAGDGARPRDRARGPVLGNYD